MSAGSPNSRRARNVAECGPMVSALGRIADAGQADLVREAIDDHETRG